MEADVRYVDASHAILHTNVVLCVAWLACSIHTRLTTRSQWRQTSYKTYAKQRFFIWQISNTAWIVVYRIIWRCQSSSPPNRIHTVPVWAAIEIHSDGALSVHSFDDGFIWLRWYEAAILACTKIDYCFISHPCQSGIQPSSLLGRRIAN